MVDRPFSHLYLARIKTSNAVNDPNKNYAIYEADREAKRKAQDFGLTIQVLRKYDRDVARSDNSGKRANILEQMEAIVREVTAQRDELLAALKALLIDFESGYVANPGKAADRKRDHHESRIRKAIANAEQWRKPFTREEIEDSRGEAWLDEADSYEDSSDE